MDPGRFNVSYRPTWTRADLMSPIGLRGPGRFQPRRISPGAETAPRPRPMSPMAEVSHSQSLSLRERPKPPKGRDLCEADVFSGSNSHDFDHRPLILGTYKQYLFDLLWFKFLIVNNYYNFAFLRY